MHNKCYTKIFPLFSLSSVSDASNVVCRAYLGGTEEVSHRMWKSSEAEKSSTWRELKAVHFALTSLKDSVQGKSVLTL